MNYAQIRKFDVTNGPGIRTTLFVSGCTHNCPGCFNKEQQDFNYGNKWTYEIEEQFLQACNNSQVIGVSILGGEPMQQIKDTQFVDLLANIKHKVNKPIWVWTGYTFEELLSNPLQRRLLYFIDVLIDGRFIESKKDYNLLYRGSSNQRIIDVKESLAKNEIVQLNIGRKLVK